MCIKLPFKTTMAVLAGSLLFACSSTKPPTQKLAQTQAAIKQAEQVGAQDYAPLAIRSARQKLDKAQDLVKQKKYEKAKRFADESAVDAELAESKALSEKAQKAVDELRESIKTLKEEIANEQQAGGTQ